MNKVTPLYTACREYIGKYPNMFKRTLAALIVKENPELFSGASHYANVEKAQNMIRILVGASGEKKRKYSDRMFMSAFVPDYQNEIKPNIQLNNGKAFIISDIHGYNSVAAERLREYFSIAKELKCDTIILNGDIIDNEQLAKWQQLGKRQRLQEEYDWVQEFMCDIKDMFPTSKLIFKAGNHEYWWQRAIWNNPNIMSIEAVEEALRLENILGIKELGFDFIDYSQGINLGKLNLFHGHEMKIGGQYIANTALNYYKCDVAFGHFHRVDKAKQTIFGGKEIRSFSLPCARTLDAGYTGNNNQWTKGFAVCEFTKDDYDMMIYTDINGKIKLF